MLFWATILSVYLALGAPPSARPFTNDDCTLRYAKFTRMLPLGPRVRIPPPQGQTLRSVESIRKLTLLQYNVKDLFNHQARWGPNSRGQWVMMSPASHRPEGRWAKLRQNIERANPDIITMQEVENLQAAEEFVNSQLGGRYRVLLINGNGSDSQSYNMALLVRQDLPFEIILQSHRDLNGQRGRIFDRDFVTADFRLPGRPESEPPIFRIHYTHNKSQRDSVGDPNSNRRRTEQVATQARLVREAERREPGVATFLMGDMNADLRSAPEFEPLWRAGFRDAFDLTHRPTPRNERTTHTFFTNRGSPIYRQMDGILVSRGAQDPGIIARAEVVRDRFPNGSEIPRARTMEERYRQASDHQGVRVEFNFERIFQGWLTRNPGANPPRASARP